MTGGIHIARGTNATINGIDVQRTVDLAVGLAKGLEYGVLNAEEFRVAGRAATRLKKARAKGYSRDICRDILWATVIDEAQKLPVKADE